MASFASQNIVCSASGQGIHGFKADLLVCKVPQKSRRWKPKAVTASKNDQFWLHACQQGEMPGSQLFKAGAMPNQLFATRPNDNAVVDFFSHAVVAQANPAVAIGKNGLDIKAIRLEFHSI